MRYLVYRILTTLGRYKLNLLIVKLFIYSYLLCQGHFSVAQNWSLQKKIAEQDRKEYRLFGNSCSISGDNMIVAAYRDQADTSLPANTNHHGSVYFYERDSSNNWNLLQKVFAPDTSDDDFYGVSVKVDGDFAIVGAQYEDEDATYQNPINRAGSAYIYRKDSNSHWNLVQKIVASDRQDSDNFGGSVSVSGNYIAVGARHNKQGSKNDAGAVYIFKQMGNGVWVETQKIVASDAETYALFGSSVSIRDNRLIIGAQYKSHDYQSSQNLGNAGGAYIFEIDSNGVWQEVQLIIPNDLAVNDNFGFSVDIEGDRAIVGSWREDEDTSGLNTLIDPGSAYSFTPDSNGVWRQTQKIIASDRSDRERFGHIVQIDGDNLVITAAVGSGSKGSIYILRRRLDGYWEEVQKIISPVLYRPINFGISAAIEKNTIVVGAYNDPYDEFGTDSLISAGSAFIFNACHTFDTITAVACENYLSISGNQVWTSSGTYRDIIPNSQGCDSIITVLLTINNITTETIDTIVCDSYISPAGNAYGTSGTYIDTLTNSKGCDSIITVNLTVGSVTSTTINPTVCESYTSPGGNTYTTSGTYIDTLTNGLGCDSIITINLTLADTSMSIISPEACESYTSPSGRYTWFTNGIYFDTLSNSSGCDSIITIKLAVNNVDATVTLNEFTLSANASGATYQWIDCDNGNSPVNGETGQSFTASANGNYAVIVIENSCADTSACYNITGVGIGEAAALADLKLYPNPTSGSLTLEWAHAADWVEVKVLDILGQELSREVVTNAYILDIELDVQPGLYFIQLNTPNGNTIVRKVIKE